MKFELLICSLVTLIFIIIIYFIFGKNGIYVKSNIDEHYYFVSDLPNKQEIADLLAQIKLNIKILLKHMKNNPNPKYIDYVKRLDNKINSVSIAENTSEVHTSYSVNKGEELIICVRSRETEQLHQINLIMYVVLHEISHIMCPEYGHGSLFQEIFKYVLEEAIKAKIYQKINFDNSPMEYCGLQIKTSLI